MFCNLFKRNQKIYITTKTITQNRKKMMRGERSLSEIISEEYHQFLGQLGQAICDKVSIDEGTDALKEIENKQYLLERIKEIIQGVYEGKDEEKMARVIEEREVYKGMVSDREAEIEQLKQHIVQLEQQLHALQQSKCEIKASQSRHLSIQQQSKPEYQQYLHEQDEQNMPWQFQKLLLQQDQQHKLRLKELTQTIRILQAQHKSVQSQLTTELQSAVEGIKLWQDKYKVLYSQKGMLQTTLEQQIENKLEQQLRNKQLSQQKQRIQVTTQNMAKLNKSLKEQLQKLQQKIAIDSHKMGTLEEQISTYQEELRVMKRVNQQLAVVGDDGEGRIGNNSNNNNNAISNQTTTILKNLKQMQQIHRKAQLQDKQKRIFQLQKKLQKTKSAKNQLELEYHEFKLSLEKKLFEVQQESNQAKISYERQLRTVKQEFMREKEAIVGAHQQAMKTLNHTMGSKEQQRITQLESKVGELQDIITKQKQNNKQLQSLISEKQLHFNQTLRFMQTNNQQQKSTIKQLQKTLSDKSNISSDFMRQYVKRVELAQQEKDRYKAQNSKMRKEMDAMRKEISALNITIQTEKNNRSYKQAQEKLNIYKKEQFQQHVKLIAEMKQQLFLLESETKHTEKQLKQRVEQVEELKCANSKLDDLLGKLKEKQVKLQRQLIQMRKELAEVQGEHHRQMAEAQRVYDSKIQAQRKTIKQHYEVLLKNRQQKINQYKQNNSLTEYQLAQDRLKVTINQLREKLNMYESKIQALTDELKRRKKEMVEKEEGQHQLKQELSELGKQVFLLKQEKLRVRKNIQAKLQRDKSVFREFKCEVYSYMKKQLDGVRQLLSSLIKCFKQYEAQWVSNKDKLQLSFYTQLSSYQGLIDQRVNSMRLHYESQVIVTHKIQLQDMQQQYMQQIKQKEIQKLAEIATRQVVNSQLLRDVQSLKGRLQKAQERIKIKQDELKAVKQELKTINTVHEKVTEKSLKLEKLVIEKERYMNEINTQNSMLKKQIIQTQQSYHHKLQQCREKYVEENQKLFNKYEKEFDKLITMNTKAKSTTLSSIMIMGNNVTPTKQFSHQKDQQQGRNYRPESEFISKKQFVVNERRQPISEKKESKLDSIKKEIIMQKKKLENLDATKIKPSLKGSASMSNINRYKNN